MSKTQKSTMKPINDNGTMVYTPKSCAPLLGISWRRVRTLCKKGKIPHAYKNAWNRWCIPQHVIDKWVAKRNAQKLANNMTLE